jgi:hypothetical protein
MSGFISSKTIRQPFYIIKSSCLPVIMSTIVGLLAVLFICKINVVDEYMIMSSLPSSIFFILQPQYLISNFWYLNYNLNISWLLLCLVFSILS